MNARAERIMSAHPCTIQCAACSMEFDPRCIAGYRFWTPFKRNSVRTFCGGCVAVTELALAMALHESDQAAEREAAARGYGSGAYQGD